MVVTNEVTDITKMEQRVDPDLANDTFELDRCIEVVSVLLLVVQY